MIEVNIAVVHLNTHCEYLWLGAVQISRNTVTIQYNTIQRGISRFIALQPQEGVASNIENE